jgi:hypothetical protein
LGVPDSWKTGSLAIPASSACRIQTDGHGNAGPAGPAA